MPTWFGDIFVKPFVLEDYKQVKCLRVQKRSIYQSNINSFMFLHLLQFDAHEYLTLNVGSQQERERGTLTCPSEVKDKASQGREFKEKKPQGMQQSDLFKAEYVFIVDSEGEEEAPGRKGDQGPPVETGPPAARPASLAISSSLASDVVRPKTRGADLQAPLHPERPQAMAPQQRHGQVGFSSCQ